MAFWENYTLGIHQLADDVWAYLQPDGSWGWNNTALLFSDNESLLILALKNYMYNLSTLLIKKCSTSFLKYINNNNDTALFLCISNGYWDLVEEIINKKCYDVNNMNKSNNCLLIYIINYGDEELALKIFNDNKDIINVNIINNDNNSLLMEPDSSLFKLLYALSVIIVG